MKRPLSSGRDRLAVLVLAVPSRRLRAVAPEHSRHGAGRSHPARPPHSTPWNSSTSSTRWWWCASGHVIGEEYWSGTASSLRQIPFGDQERHLDPDRHRHRSRGSSRVASRPEWWTTCPRTSSRTTQTKQEIRIWHLLTMSSGFEWDEDADVVPWLYGPDPVGAHPGEAAGGAARERCGTTTPRPATCCR